MSAYNVRSNACHQVYRVSQGDQGGKYGREVALLDFSRTVDPIYAKVRHVTENVKARVLRGEEIFDLSHRPSVRVPNHEMHLVVLLEFEFIFLFRPEHQQHLGGMPARPKPDHEGLLAKHLLPIDPRHGRPPPIQGDGHHH